MRRIVLISFILPVLTLPILVLSSSGQGLSKPPTSVMIDRGGRTMVMPSTFQLACADGNNYLSHLNWGSWRQGYAAARGTQTMNDCTPSCALGTFRTYPVHVVVWGNAAVTGHSDQRRFAMITLRYPGRPPSVYSGTTKVTGPRAITSKLWNPMQPAS